MTKHTNQARSRLAGVSAILVSTFAATAADSPVAAPSATSQAAKPAAERPWIEYKKPAWLTEFSVGVKEGYDNNIFLSDTPAAPGAKAGPGSVLADKEKSSWITTFSPKLSFNLAPLLGDQKVLQSLSLGYAPDFVFYHDQRSEDNILHRFTTGIKGKSDAFSFNLDNAFHFIDGSEYGPTYSLGRSAYATSAERERRQQFQDRSKISFQYDQEQWFVRPVASLLYYELQTKQINAVGAYKGYDNYADRYDVNGGVDFGYKINPKMAATLGYRYGHQYQEQYAWDTVSSPSDYHRILGGFEGKPWKWLKAELQFGPDFRTYAPSAPVSDFNPVKLYGEAALTAEISSNDSLAFKYKQYQWVASTGRAPYLESSYDLTYRHKFSRKLTFDLGGKLGSSDYTSGNIASSLRDDKMYTISTGVGYAFNPNLSANLAYSVDLGCNAQDRLTPATEQSREFTRHLVFLGLQFKL